MRLLSNRHNFCFLKLKLFERVQRSENFRFLFIQIYLLRLFPEFLMLKQISLRFKFWLSSFILLLPPLDSVFRLLSLLDLNYFLRIVLDDSASLQESRQRFAVHSRFEISESCLIVFFLLFDSLSLQRSLCFVLFGGKLVFGDAHSLISILDSLLFLLLNQTLIIIGIQTLHVLQKTLSDQSMFCFRLFSSLFWKLNFD